MDNVDETESFFFSSILFKTLYRYDIIIIEIRTVLNYTKQTPHTSHILSVINEEVLYSGTYSFENVLQVNVSFPRFSQTPY